MLGPWTKGSDSRPRSSGRWRTRAGSRSSIGSAEGPVRGGAPRVRVADQPAERLPAPGGARAAGLVEAERDGREVRYRLTDPDVMTACGIMRGVLERRLRRLIDWPAFDGPVVAPHRSRRAAAR